MTIKQRWKTSGATVAMLAMMVNNAAFAQTVYAEPAITAAGATGTVGAQNATNPSSQTALAQNDKVRLIRQKIKYVFVLFQENRSFDHYFGTYPGANGLYSTYPGANPADPMAVPANQTGSFTQAILNTGSTVTYGTQTPFLMPRTVQDTNNNTVNIYPEDSLSVDHSHTGIVNSGHFDQATRSIAKNDAYVLDQEGLGYSGDASTTATIVTKAGAPVTAPASLAQKQAGELMVAHVDCDTIPFLWQYADRFAMFDNMHMTAFGPSTPNAIAMIAGQTGETQWALHPNQTGLHIPGGQSIPNVTDTAPYSGGTTDTSSGPKPPYGPDEASFTACTTAGQTGTAPACPTPTAPANYGPLTTVKLKGPQAGYFGAQPTLTSATLPLSFMGPDINTIVAQDENPTMDLLDIQNDIKTIAAYPKEVQWGWYQQGYGAEPFDGQATDQPAARQHAA